MGRADTGQGVMPMYIDADIIIKAASIVTALGVLLGGLFRPHH